MHKGKGRALEVETAADPLDDLKIETELRKEFAGDIAHQRQVGSYRGRRYVPLLLPYCSVCEVLQI